MMTTATCIQSIHLEHMCSKVDCRWMIVLVLSRWTPRVQTDGERFHCLEARTTAVSETGILQLRISAMAPCQIISMLFDVGDRWRRSIDRPSNCSSSVQCGPVTVYSNQVFASTGSNVDPTGLRSAGVQCDVHFLYIITLCRHFRTPMHIRFLAVRYSKQPSDVNLF